MSDRRAREQQRKKFQELITGHSNEARSKRLRTSEDIRQVSEVSNNNPGIINSGSRDNPIIISRGNDNDKNPPVSGSGRENIIISRGNDNDKNPVSGSGRGKSRGNDNNDDRSIIYGGGRGRGQGKGKSRSLSNEDNNDNNFRNYIEGIRKYIKVIIFRFIIKNFLFLTYIRMIERK
jgi:hypothetical protein